MEEWVDTRMEVHESALSQTHLYDADGLDEQGHLDDREHERHAVQKLPRILG